MRKFQIWLVAFLAATSLSCEFYGFDLDFRPNKVPVKVYTHEDARITMTIPKDWIAFDKHSNKKQYGMIQKDLYQRSKTRQILVAYFIKDLEMDYPPTIQLVQNKHLSKGEADITMDDRLDAWYDYEEESSTSWAKYHDVIYWKFGKYKVMNSAYISPSDFSVVMETFEYYTAKNMYTITMECNQKDIDTYKPLFKEVVESFATY